MKILYLSFTNTNHSLNAVYVKGLLQNRVEVLEYYSKSGRLKKYFDILKFYFANRQGTEVIIVGYQSPKLVWWLRLFSRKTIVYNALCSIIERFVISRKLASRYSVKFFYYWFQDFLACLMADLILLESTHQIDFFQKVFLVPRKRMFRAWTGVDEEKYFYDPGLEKFQEFTVIFRGRLLPESGAEYVVKAAKKLERENVHFILHAFGQEHYTVKNLIDKLKPNNLEFISDFLPIEEVRTTMQKSHLSLGQLSAHARLQRTIPHKAYESLVLRLPYLTARNPAILEFLRENETCLACNPADVEDLAAKILWAKEHPAELKAIAERAYKFYLEELTPKVLAKKVLKRLENEF